MDRIKILLIEDNLGDARLIHEMLSEAKSISFDFEWKDRLSKGLEHLVEGGIDVVLLDLMLPDSQGFDTFIKMQAQAPEIPIVVLTGLSDETLAIRAVRKGAQDYLVKGKVDSDMLVRAILYAIARRLGEEKYFAIPELRIFDGKEGRPAYVSFEGRVYDVSNSRLWKDGLHLGSHHAGYDLTENMMRAPHGEEVLSKFHIVGELSHEEPLRHRLVHRIRQRIMKRMDGLHLHTPLVQFSIAYSVIVPLLSILYIYTGEAFFERASYYMLALGFIILSFAALLCLLSGKEAYRGNTTEIFNRKIILTIALAIIITVCFVWRTLYPDILITEELNYIYLALLVSMIPIIAAYHGKKIV